MKYKSCFAKLVQNAFNTEYRTVDYSEFTFISSITKNVDVVKYERARYVHKYMRPGDLQSDWEAEFRNYVKLRHCEDVSSLLAVVRNSQGRVLIVYTSPLNYCLVKAAATAPLRELLCQSLYA